jgi:hypothetical protein
MDVIGPARLFIQLRQKPQPLLRKGQRQLPAPIRSTHGAVDTAGEPGSLAHHCSEIFQPAVREDLTEEDLHL